MLERSGAGGLCCEYVVVLSESSSELVDHLELQVIVGFLAEVPLGLDTL